MLTDTLFSILLIIRLDDVESFRKTICLSHATALFGMCFVSLAIQQHCAVDAAGFTYPPTLAAFTQFMASWHGHAALEARS